MVRAIVGLGLAALALGGCATAYCRGEAALRAGHPAEAVPYLEEAHRATPERLDVRVALGIARYRTRIWDAAVGVLDGVVAEAPHRADARLFLGLAHLMKGDVGAARTDLEAVRALDLHPRIAAQLDRVLPFLGSGLEAARRSARTPLEPAWSLVWDHGPGGLYLLHRPPLPARP